MCETVIELYSRSFAATWRSNVVCLSQMMSVPPYCDFAESRSADFSSNSEAPDRASDFSSNSEALSGF